MAERILFDLLVVVVFLVMMTILVAAHEFGHYVFARLFGMGVREFSIGFGKPVLLTYWRKKHRILLEPKDLQEDASSAFSDPVSSRALALAAKLEGGEEQESPGDIVEAGGRQYLEETTRFTIRAWPLGGFVRIKGMIPTEDSSETRVPGGFYRKSPFARFVVLLAGPLFSVLAGILLLIPYNMIVGAAVPNTAPVVGLLEVGAPAQKAGLEVGDKIVSVNGKPVKTFYDVLSDIRYAGPKAITIVVDRNGQTQTLSVVPKLFPNSVVVDSSLQPTPAVSNQYKIGAGWETVQVPMSFGEASVNACILPVATVAGLASSFVHPKQLEQNVGGPEMMVKLTAQATSDGFYQVVLLAALLSISLGIFNLLPFPPLDGGQMVIALVEMLRRGKRLSLKVQGIVFTTGLAVVGMLVALVLFVDFNRGSQPDSAANAKFITSQDVKKAPVKGASQTAPRSSPAPGK